MSAPNVIPAKAGIQYAYCASLGAARPPPPSRLKPRGNAATGASFAGGVLDSRLRGNDGSIRARLADQTMPENVDKNTPQPLQKLPGLLSEAELAQTAGVGKSAGGPRIKRRPC